MPSTLSVSNTPAHLGQVLTASTFWTLGRGSILTAGDVERNPGPEQEQLLDNNGHPLRTTEIESGVFIFADATRSNTSGPAARMPIDQDTPSQDFDSVRRKAPARTRQDKGQASSSGSSARHRANLASSSNSSAALDRPKEGAAPDGGDRGETSGGPGSIRALFRHVAGRR